PPLRRDRARDPRQGAGARRGPCLREDRRAAPARRAVHLAPWPTARRATTRSGRSSGASKTSSRTSARSSATSPDGPRRRSGGPGQGSAGVFRDEAGDLPLEHLLPPPQGREASARLVAALCEKLDAMEPSTRVLVVATTTRTDALDPTLVAPGRLDHLIEIALPDTDDQREIMELIRGRTEKNAGRQLFAPIDYDKVLPVMGGMSGADISVILRRTLEAK